jgi:hypothetical protein
LRGAEVTLLVECLAAAVEGQPQIVMLRGEPGIGETRLAEERSLERALAALSAWRLASDAVGAPPSWPRRQVLNALAAVVDVAERVSDATATPEDRFRQFDAVTAFSGRVHGIDRS